MRMLRNSEVGGASKAKKKSHLTATPSDARNTREGGNAREGHNACEGDIAIGRGVAHEQGEMCDKEADVEMTRAEQVLEGFRVATLFRNDAQIDAEDVDEDDDYDEDFEKGNGIDVVVDGSNAEGRRCEHSDAWWFNERSA